MLCPSVIRIGEYCFIACGFVMLCYVKTKVSTLGNETTHNKNHFFSSSLPTFKFNSIRPKAEGQTQQKYWHWFSIRKITALQAAFFYLLGRAAAFGCNGWALWAQPKKILKKLFWYFYFSFFRKIFSEFFKIFFSEFFCLEIILG